MTPDDALQAALDLAKQGYPVLPCARNKKPLLKDWPNVASCDPDRVRELWRNEEANEEWLQELENDQKAYLAKLK